jgi:hypothetical protein
MQASIASRSRNDSQYPQEELQQAIRRRAQEIYEESGRIPGRDLENWVQAEHDVLAAESAQRRVAILVRVNGIEYVGEYSAAAGGYMPGEFAPGDPITVRFEGEKKMYICLRNGTELETAIVESR